jgi:hypothetical protein
MQRGKSVLLMKKACGKILNFVTADAMIYVNFIVIVIIIAEEQEALLSHCPL